MTAPWPPKGGTGTQTLTVPLTLTLEDKKI